jgi:enamine deaminase RidA (YjgF/YER057c/UK114 family)
MFHVKRISSGSAFESKLGYSRAIVKGPWCFVSGITGYDYATMTLPTDAAAQARNSLATLGRVLAEAGFSAEDVVRVTYILKSDTLVDEVAPELQAVFGNVRPAATMFVAELIKPEILFEVEATAFRPADG